MQWPLRHSATFAPLPLPPSSPLRPLLRIRRASAATIDTAIRAIAADQNLDYFSAIQAMAVDQDSELDIFTRLED